MFYSEARNLYVVTGARGVGKTTFAATFAPPNMLDQVFVHDSENSWNNILGSLKAQKLKLGYYENLSARFVDAETESDLLARLVNGEVPWVTKEQKNALVGYYQWTLESIEKNLKKDKFSVYIHDTIELLEAGMAALVEDRSRDFGLKGNIYAYGKLWTQGVYPYYQQVLNAIWERGVQHIIFTSHLKSPWIDDKPIPGKVVPAGKKLLYKQANLFLWLVRDDRTGDGTPAGLLVKERTGKLVADLKNNKWIPRRVLPNRLPRCTWEAIAEYERNPANLKSPRPEEIPTSEEQDLIDEFAISDKAMELMTVQGRIQLEELRQTSGIIETESGNIGTQEVSITGNGRNDELLEKVKEYLVENPNASNFEIKRELNIPSLSEVVELKERINSEN